MIQQGHCIDCTSVKIMGSKFLAVEKIIMKLLGITFWTPLILMTVMQFIDIITVKFKWAASISVVKVSRHDAT